MVRAVVQIQELEKTHAAWRAQDVFQDALVTPRRGPRVLRVTRRLDLVLVTNGHHPLDEVIDTFPEHIRGDDTGNSRWRIGIELRSIERAVRRIATARCGWGARHTENAHVVLERRDAYGRQGFDTLMNVVDVLVALGTFAQHDRVASLGVHVGAPQERQGHHLHHQSVCGSEVLYSIEV